MHYDDTTTPSQEEALETLLKIVRKAYSQRLISKTHNYDQIIYKIEIPHEKTGEGRELYRLAGSHQH
jgi:hypothetical protein